jgi:uncharacterized protein (DUF2235 family)
MKRIVLCFDGTWEHPGDSAVPAEAREESNVSRFRESILPTASDGVRQDVWYNEGVGTAWWNHFTGGAFGSGLDYHIIKGYEQLAKTYEDGDEIYIVGFSRGAYTARSLVGMVRNCGLVRPNFAPVFSGVAYGIYRTRDDGPDSATARAFRSTFSREIQVHFLGVWDTVGALGIPLEFADQLNMLLYQFHDTELSNVVRNAFQAAALDEHRKTFDITLWNPKTKPDQTMEQRWFVGAHCDVGGGYSDRRLSDITLRWMQDRASASGLGLSRVPLAAESYLAPPTDSYAKFLGPLVATVQPPYFRRVLGTTFGNEVIDSTVDLRRVADPTYRPPNPGLPIFGA